jgi:hypothetical protein
MDAGASRLDTKKHTTVPCRNRRRYRHTFIPFPQIRQLFNENLFARLDSLARDTNSGREAYDLF